MLFSGTTLGLMVLFGVKKIGWKKILMFTANIGSQKNFSSLTLDKKLVNEELRKECLNYPVESVVCKSSYIEYKKKRLGRFFGA